MLALRGIWRNIAGMDTTNKPTQSTERVIEVVMKFYKSFHVIVPEGVTEADVIETEFVDDESRGLGISDIELEHDETSTKDEGTQTAQQMDSLRRHSKVLTWDEIKGE